MSKTLEQVMEESLKLQEKLTTLAADIAWLRSSEAEAEVDWSQVAIGEPVLVRDDSDHSGSWKPRLFAGVGRGAPTAYNAISNQSGITDGVEAVDWNRVKIDYTRKSHINWITNQGISPDCETVLTQVQEESGSILVRMSDTRKLVWQVDGAAHPIIKFAIIK